MAQKQPTAAELAALQMQKNNQFMSYSFEQAIKANSQNGTVYQPGQTLNFDAPIVAGAYATKITIRHNVTLDWDGVGTAKLNAAAPHNLVNQMNVSFGNKQITAHPYLAKVLDYMEGYARQEQDDAPGFKLSEIDAMLKSVPTTIVSGENKFKFDTTFDLNQLHPQSVN
jgi:hypothetical protein